jgi:hypothetical protein
VNPNVRRKVAAMVIYVRHRTSAVLGQPSSFSFIDEFRIVERPEDSGKSSTLPVGTLCCVKRRRIRCSLLGVVEAATLIGQWEGGINGDYTLTAIARARELKPTIRKAHHLSFGYNANHTL